jgi:hypothetical protein
MLHLKHKRMKRKKYFLLGILSFLILSACEDLTPEVRTTLAPSEVYWNYGRVQSMALAPYSYLQEGFININGAMMASTCDEAEHTQET